MFTDNKDFYPTPRTLINKMLNSIDFNTIRTVLEPSAGKGDLVEATISELKNVHGYSYNRDVKWDIDTVELDQNLQYILQGKGYRIIHNDFLTLETYKQYDLIVMNPPFANGDKHLLKALQMQEKGGKIVCLLNAETIKNPCTNTRKELNRRLEQYNASIEYLQDAFIDAERQTYVEVVLIKIDIPKAEHNSVILDNLKKEEQFRAEADRGNFVVDADFIKGIIQQYNYEVKAGLKLIAEYEALQPLMLSSLKEDCSKNLILELKLHYDDKDGSTLLNGYIKQTRMKYWSALFTDDKFMGLFTSNLRQKYYNKVNELKDYDFSLFNIQTIKNQLNNEMIKAVEDTILALFDEFSHQHYWDKDNSQNIHYYDGWKTNKAWKINNKVIIPLNGFNWYDKNRLNYDYKVIDKLTDIEKVFNYLQIDMKAENIDLKESLKTAQHYGESKKIKCQYFYITFYKKGTCHIEFKDIELLHKFNIFGSQRKGWIPPSYGKKSYKEMTEEEKDIINSFEGKDSYNKVMLNKNYYILETSKLLMLA